MTLTETDVLSVCLKQQKSKQEHERRNRRAQLMCMPQDNVEVLNAEKACGAWQPHTVDGGNLAPLEYTQFQLPSHPPF